jgi:hypothetical protein
LDADLLGLDDHTIAIVQVFAGALQPFGVVKQPSLLVLLQNANLFELLRFVIASAGRFDGFGIGEFLLEPLQLGLVAVEACGQTGSGGGWGVTDFKSNLFQLSAEKTR